MKRINETTARAIMAREDCERISGTRPTMLINGMGTWRTVYWVNRRPNPFLLVDTATATSPRHWETMSPGEGYHLGFVTIEILMVRAPTLARRILERWLEKAAGWSWTSRDELAVAQARLEQLSNR